ncbi:hypothetical protein UA08_03000 [Talaromyces atroroseus]|uniref:NF-kappa-B inhibitor-like protein 1 n=1 Tax=Talaromyces atroroseus TaxID=1441469 RepID=A0A225AXT6_TALAT|nr:hypothetical protein UA08_03000 [Talaromyces atroroseus]OKL62148.1 hypothetical protein UA08_03000 [Talaromyces atroroseus]
MDAATATESKPFSDSTSENKDRLDESEYPKSRSSKFRFKSSRSRSHHSKHEDHDDRHRHRRRHHHRHKSQHSSKRQKIDQDPPASPGHNERRSLSPDTAFRESLFDAMGDDEGAAYWESVYGQPIHTYAVPSVPKGPDGELERMTDEEYTAYVRARMWERSHEGIMEERERQRREKAKAKQRSEAGQQADKDRARFNEALEESLRRGEKRRRAKLWETTWEKYLKSWEELSALSSSASKPQNEDAEAKSQFFIRNHIHWPVDTGKRRDISHEAVKEFMEHAPATSESSAAHEDLLSTLKAERIRWHPDKMLHRYGSLGLKDEKALVQSVTEVFQILDQLWIEEKGRRSKG